MSLPKDGRGSLPANVSQGVCLDAGWGGWPAEERLGRAERQANLQHTLQGLRAAVSDALLVQDAPLELHTGAGQALALIDTNRDGQIDEAEFEAYLAAHRTEPTCFGAELVRVSGAVLQHGGKVTQYAGINGVYERSENVVNGRFMFTKLSTSTTALWWGNVLGKICWVVGPKAGAGTSNKIWAYVESFGKSPEQAAGRPWMVYSYDDRTYARQEAITIQSIDAVVLRLQCSAMQNCAQRQLSSQKLRVAEAKRMEEVAQAAEAKRKKKDSMAAEAKRKEKASMAAEAQRKGRFY